MAGVLRRRLPQNETLRRVGGPFLPATTGEAFGAATGMETTGTVAARRAGMGAAEGERRNITQGPFLPLIADFLGAEPPEPSKPRVHPEKLNKRYRNLGLNFDRPMTETSARLIAEAKRAEMIRQDVIGRARGAAGLGATLAGGLVATAIDPLEVASAFVPVVGQARAAGLIARFGAVRGRAAVGLTEGAAGNAMIEPVFGTLAREQQLDYGMADALINVGLGAAFGGLAGTALGAANRRGAFRRALEIANEPRPGGTEPPFGPIQGPTRARQQPVPAAVRQMDNETRVAAHRAALAQVAEGRSVDVSAFAPERAASGPRARGPESITQFIARTGGVNDADPTFRGEVAALGDRSIRDTSGRFRGRLARADAERNLDDLAEDAAQQGFIENRDVRELLDAIDRDLRGEPVVRRQEQAEQMGRAEAAQSRQEADRLLSEFDAARNELQDVGITDATPEEIQRVGEIMSREGLPADDAFERVAIERAQDVATREADPRRDAVADFEASARVQQEIDEAFDVSGDSEELLAMIEQMRQDGTLPREADEAIAAADTAAAKAQAYARTAREAAACLAR